MYIYNIFYDTLISFSTIIRHRVTLTRCRLKKWWVFFNVTFIIAISFLSNLNIYFPDLKINIFLNLKQASSKVCSCSKKKNRRVKGKMTILPAAVQRAIISDLQVCRTGCITCHATPSHASSSVSNNHWSNSLSCSKAMSHGPAHRAKYLSKSPTGLKVSIYCIIKYSFIAGEKANHIPSKAKLFVIVWSEDIKRTIKGLVRSCFIHWK